jgi:hypothetical protein
MNLFDLTPEQLKRAASIKERIDGLNRQLRGILGAPATPRASTPATASARAAVKKKRMSPAARAKLSAKLKAYWAAKKKSGKK